MAEDEKPRLNVVDETLFEAALTGEGVIEVTPDLWKAMETSIRERTADVDARYPALVEACPYETKLAVVAWAIGHIVDHATEGGSFRYLIYDRMGFGPDAYLPLYQAGGMTISNEFSLGGSHDGDHDAG